VRLSTLFDEFAAVRQAQFRALVAFASAGGLEHIGEALHRFLKCGHSIFWIVGVDLGGTGREALEFFIDLKRRYGRRVDARIFSVGDNAFVFHPKVYWFDSDTRKVVVVGSANATVGGLARNFETSVEIEINGDGDGEIVREFDGLWMTYSTPLPPLSAANLININTRLLTVLGPDDPPTDGSSARPHPFSGLPKPRMRGRRRLLSTSTATRNRRRRVGGELVMDVLLETRQTQVQLPVGALRPFFGVPPTKRVALLLHQIYGDQIVKSDMRPIINLPNNTHRIELDAIRGLPRPLIVRFGRAAAGSFTYELILRGTAEHRILDALLASQGRRARDGARRWLIR
jgi:HKD family nuclease